MLPAEKRLQPSDFSGGDAHLRLIDEEKFFPFQRQPQAILQRQALHHPKVNVLRKEVEAVTSIFFGAVHGSVGILDQGFAVAAMFRKDTDAQTTTNLKSLTLDHEFLGY